MIQNLSRELFAVADENGGKLKNRVILFCDELGTMPPFDILPLFSAGRSRRLTLVPIIQSLAQLEKNYGKEGASILMDNCQDVICGGFAPNSEAAETFSKALGNRTVLSGSVNRGKSNPSQSLQMMARPLLTADELKSIPKGSFIVQKPAVIPCALVFVCSSIGALPSRKNTMWRSTLPARSSMQTGMHCLSPFCENIHPRYRIKRAIVPQKVRGNSTMPLHRMRQQRIRIVIVCLTNGVHITSPSRRKIHELL